MDKPTLNQARLTINLLKSRGFNLDVTVQDVIESLSKRECRKLNGKLARYSSSKNAGKLVIELLAKIKPGYAQASKPNLQATRPTEKQVNYVLFLENKLGLLEDGRQRKDELNQFTRATISTLISRLKRKVDIERKEVPKPIEVYESQNNELQQALDRFRKNLRKGK